MGRIENDGTFRGNPETCEQFADDRSYEMQQLGYVYNPADTWATCNRIFIKHLNGGVVPELLGAEELQSVLDDQFPEIKSKNSAAEWIRFADETGFGNSVGKLEEKVMPCPSLSFFLSFLFSPCSPFARFL